MIAPVTLGAGVIVLVLLLIARKRLRRYRAAFSLPVVRDDDLVCRTDPQTFPVELDSAGFALPGTVERRGQTAFLRIDVEPSFIGRHCDLSVEIDDGRVRYRQFLERGAAGRRFLEVSPLLHSEIAERRVSLRARGLRWNPEATLMVFEPPPIPLDGVLVLAPHPDDAEIAAYGLYATRGSWVATMTAGESSGLDLGEIVPDREEASGCKARLRLWDSLAIPALGGVAAERCVNLVFPDGRLEDMFRAPAATFEIACEAHAPRKELRALNRLPAFQVAKAPCSWDGFVAELRLLLETVRPSAVVCPHPLLEVHPDHVHTAVALDQALRGGNFEVPLVLLYSVDVRDARLHPFGPATAVASLPPLPSDGWVADSLYSHRLPTHIRQGKYFAVEAAHDLRTFPAGAPDTLGGIWMSAKRGLSSIVTRLERNPFSYTRRGPRPNEIYYVVSPASLSALVERALKACHDRNHAS